MFEYLDGSVGEEIRKLRIERELQAETVGTTV